MCAQDLATFEELAKCVKHLLYWGLGRLIHPIKPTTVVCLTPEAGCIHEALLA